MVYGQLSNLIIKSLEIELESLGYSKVKEDNGDINIYAVDETGRKFVNNEFFINYFKDIFNAPLYSVGPPGVGVHAFAAPAAAAAGCRMGAAEYQE